MADPDNGSGVEKLALAALGAFSLTADRADQLADALAAKGGLRREEARALVHELTSRWRGDAIRVGEGTRRRVQDVAREVGLVTREEWDELELRVAQLEHRVRLLESD